jgi:transcriptional regulator with XRE-family HTH domain
MSRDRPLSVLIAAEIRKQLFLRDMTGTQLAEHAGMTQPYISRRLTGATAFDVDDLERIATALDVDVADLLPARADRRSHNKTLPTPPVRPSGPRSQRALLAPGHAPERHPTSRPAAETSGASRTELRRPAITGHTHSGSST